ncbi:MAG: hypothetical protein HOK30_20200 [Rhodospirillaceae bacterium]|jgi:uncharacterized protein (TIGR02466 family)|nr:hypothetical protein [Rhodospirillaceae bacterium]MBT6430003.1 hypothetical protein [Rhodospirillaceae bacterium]
MNVLNRTTENTASSQPELMLNREMYFPTLVYSLDIPDKAQAAALNDSVKSHIYGWRDSDRDGIQRSNANVAGAWHSPPDMARRPEYADLVDLVLHCSQAVFQDLGYDPAYQPGIDNMWANVNPRHGYNRSHFHPNVLWSGCYYVQVPSDAGRITFYDPRTEAQMLQPKFAPNVERRRQLQEEISYDPVEGRVLLFPAWLAHDVEPNMCALEGPAADRISVAFNITQGKPPGAG